MVCYQGTTVMYMYPTGKNIASNFGISREDQDKFALKSHLKADKATESGHFAKEISPIVTIGENGEEVITTKHYAIRGRLTCEKLACLKPVLKEDGATIAGNSSQVSDSGAATIRANAEKLSLNELEDLQVLMLLVFLSH